MIQQDRLAGTTISTMTSQEFRPITAKLGSEVKATTKCELDVAYGPNERHKVDIYYPDEAPADPLPVLMLMHGGYWRLSDKASMAFVAPSIICTPAILVSVGFRLATEIKYPGPVDDCRAALKWVYDNIAERGGDPNRIFVGGHSSGGHLSSLITLQRDKLREIGLPDGVIKGCFPISGVFDLSDPERIEVFLNSADEVTEASPLFQTSGNVTPFFITIGENDRDEHRNGFRDMVAALGKERGRVDSLDNKDLNHFTNGLIAGEIDGLWAVKVRELILELKPE